jgi:NAD(P)-dependent dehydrogenase (short-subunit alcohol dehydrogenase family)
MCRKQQVRGNREAGQDGEDKMGEMQLAGRTAIVTGGAGAFGKAIGLELAGMGASVVVADLDEAAARRTAEEIGGEGGRSTLAVGCDVSREPDVQKLMEIAVETFSKVDVLVNNAGIFPTGPLAQTTVENWDRIMDVNVRGVFLCCKHVIPYMADRDRGCIVNIASALGRAPVPNLVPYSASKAAVIALTVGLAKEVAAKGIRVNAVCPSAVATPGWAPSLKAMATARGMSEDAVMDSMVEKQLIKRMLTPQEIARVVSWLASDATSMITGQAIGIDGGVAFPTF